MSNQQENYEAYVEGTRSIVRDYLKLERGENFLIICDETGREIADYVKPEAEALGAKVRVFEYNTELQAKILDDNVFPLELRSMIHEAHCILICLSAKPECTQFRKLAIKIGQKFGTRIAHMPGLTAEDLKTMFKANFSEMSRWRTILLRVLYLARRCTIITGKDMDSPCELHLDLGGTERLPAQSGKVRDGSWCNIPGAEVYIAPLENSAHGKIVINGSMLDHVLSADVLIEFETGKMINWESSSVEFQKIMAQFANNWKHDPNWNKLCEFGIGLNDKFTRLTGKQLLDEKMKGTCHIAIGESTNFGGKINSLIHQDFVTVAPDIIIDGKKIMEDGNFTIDESDCFEDLNTINSRETDFTSRKFRLTGRPIINKYGKLGLDFWDARSQEVFFQVGNDATAVKLQRFLDFLEQEAEFLDGFTYAQIKDKFEQVPSMLALLLKYDLIEFVGNGNAK